MEKCNYLHQLKHADIINSFIVNIINNNGFYFEAYGFIVSLRYNLIIRDRYACHNSFQRDPCIHILYIFRYGSGAQLPYKKDISRYTAGM